MQKNNKGDIILLIKRMGFLVQGKRFNIIASMLHGVHREWIKVFINNDALTTTLAYAIKMTLKHTNEQLTLCPAPHRIFECFKYFSPHNTRVVIIGQDPYTSNERASGLSFSTANGEMSSSLHNINKAIIRSCGQSLESGNLEHWARQGVLLLNSRLTTTIDGAKHTYWTMFTDAVISWLDKYVENVVFLLWGNYAKQKHKIIKNSIALMYTHPSPTADCKLPRSKQFSRCEHFKQVNTLFKSRMLKVITWVAVFNIS